MSWYREIKLLYTLFVNTLLFIVWSVIYYIIVGQTIKDIMVFILFVSTIIVIILNERFIINKKDNIRKATINLTVYLMFAPLIYLTCKFNTKILIGSELFLLLIIIGTYKREYEPIIHSMYNEKIKNGFIVFLISGVLGNILNKNLSIFMFKFYIILLVSAVLLLKESRNYEFKIRDKRSNVYNICFLIFAAFINIPKVYNLIINGFEYILRLLYNVYELLMEKIIQVFYILSKPLGTLIEKVFKISNAKQFNGSANGIKTSQNFLRNIKQNKQNEQKLNMNFNILYFIFMVCITVMLLFILWKIYLSINANIFSEKEINCEEEVEKIRRAKEERKKFKFVKNTFKNVFENVSIKDKILSTYKIFQNNSKKKGIYKNYMTATQLSNVSKIYIDKVEDLDSIAKVYNEVKFSNHDATKEHLDKIKKNYNNIKNKMK